MLPCLTPHSYTALRPGLQHDEQRECAALAMATVTWLFLTTDIGVIEFYYALRSVYLVSLSSIVLRILWYQLQAAGYEMPKSCWR